jgi:hypothetical protein
MVGRAVAVGAAGTVGLAVLVVAIVLGLVAAHGATFCATTGYLNLAPIVIATDARLDAVAACIGTGCRPVELRVDDGGTWEVPQRAPYLGGDARVGAVDEVTVRAELEGRVIAEDSFAVYRVPLGGGGRCPGPFDYAPVTLATR